MASLLYRLGAFSLRRRREVLGAWLALLIGLGFASQALSGTTDDAFSIPGTESQRALDLLGDKFPGTGGASARIVFAAPKGERLDDPRYAGLVDPTLAAAKAVPQVLGGAPLSEATVSEDGRIAFTDIQFDVSVDQLTDDTKRALEAVGEPARRAGLDVEFSGGVVSSTESEAASTEAIGVAVAFVVLLITFGAFTAAGLPLLTAIIGVGVGLLGIQALSGIMTLSSTAPTLALMLGLAVGIDYALFIVSRHRQQLRDGMDVETSIPTAIGTAGSAVVFAGVTVFIALAGMVVVGIPFLSVMGLAAAGTVVVAVLIALTLLPALMGFAGERLRKGRHPGSQKETLGLRWVRFVTRYPIPIIVGIVVALGIVASPALDLRVGLPDASTQSEETTERRAYDLLTTGFGPGFNGPLTVVVDATAQEASAPRVFTGVAEALQGLPDVTSVTPPAPNPAGQVAILSVTPSSGPSTVATNDLVDEIRRRAAPVREEFGVDVLVTGTTAVNIDVSSKLNGALPTFLVLVVGLALLLLLAVFRSIAVPIKAVVGFLLTIAASLGLIVFIFQKGNLGELFAVAAPAPIISFLPVLMIAILFGLAMDYEVFLVSRMREKFVSTGDADRATQEGFAASARVVTAAGLIMIAVFSGFILAPDPVTKSIGLALAFGVAVDAFLVRMTLVPAVLALLGRRAWSLPGWLDRILPELDVEGERLVAQTAPATRSAAPPGDETP